jgi:hypothetical protein
MWSYIGRKYYQDKTRQDMANLGGDENEILLMLKRDQLGVYLRDCGILFSTRNKDDSLTLA